ncbi:MAG: hypothetical protein LDL44_03155 [Caenispirillum sp.]|nr:hypothetical protein [Caenispirillum sp.]
MATAACYLGQLGVLALLMTFAVRAYRAGALAVGGWLVATFIVTVLLWDCRYTLRITGDNNMVVDHVCK